MIKHLICVFAAALALASCAGTPQLGGSSEIKVVELAGLPAPDGTLTEGARPAYRVGANDKLLVDVVGIEQLKEREFEIDSSGELSLPLAGRIKAAGLTPAELEQEIGYGLRTAFVRDPDVSVNVVEIRSRTMTVDGSVREPGQYAATNDMTLMRAVARAKGVTEFARLDDVVIFRQVQDEQMVALYNLGAIRRGAYADPPIYADDVIVVGESTGRKLFQNIVQAGVLVTAPLVAILQR